MNIMKESLPCLKSLCLAAKELYYWQLSAVIKHKTQKQNTEKSMNSLNRMTPNSKKAFQNRTW